MKQPSMIIDFGAVDEGSLDEGEKAKVHEQAAAVVSDFVARTALPALEQILQGAGEADPATAAQQGRDLAEKLGRQSEILDDEVARFLALARKR